MRNSCLTLLLLAALHTSPATADNFEQPADSIYGHGPYPGVLCDVCRDPYEHPMDFVAVAFNAFFGEDPWLMGSDLGWPLRVYNLKGDWVVIWFEDVLFDMPSLLPNLLQVYVRFQNGLVVPYSVIQDGPDLPVDEQPDAPSCACVGGGEDGEEYEEPDDYEFEGPDLEGVVEIVDPDEDGEFPPWEEEL